MFRTSSVHQERFYKLFVQIWYVVIRVLLDTCSRYEVVGGNFVYLVGLHIYYKMTHGPYSVKFVYLVGLHIYYKMIYGPYNIS